MKTRIIATLLLTAIAGSVSADSISVVQINMKKVVVIDGGTARCPHFFQSINVRDIIGQPDDEVEAYCTKSGITRGDAVCVPVTTSKVVFRTPRRGKAYKFVVDLEKDGDLDCNNAEEYAYVKVCNLEDDMFKDGELSYTIKTKTCEYDPRIIVSNSLMNLDFDALLEAEEALLAEESDAEEMEAEESEKE